MADPTFSVRLSDPVDDLTHIWEHTVGSCHAPLALRADWQTQLAQCHRELGFRHTRFHGLLCDEMGTLLDEMDRAIYQFFNADQIVDFLLSIGMKPFVELSFMPLMLASGSTTVFHYNANVTPPKDYAAWALLVERLVRHWVERYGIGEVATWLFEVWNEPNLKAFWTGTQDEYFHLYKVTAQAIKGVDERLQVGGPATASNAWIPEFLDFCERDQVHVDFVSTHHYPTDALGTIGEDTETQLSQSKRSILRDWAARSKSEARGKPLYYTEWNASSNPRDHLHDEPYTACVIAKTMMEARGLVQGYSFWTFTDIFEENFMPANAYQGGFGLLTMQGVPKPSYRAFELLHRLGTDELPVQGAHDTVDVWVVRTAVSVTVLISNHALPKHPIGLETVRVTLQDHPEPVDAYIERIDDDNANAKRLWLEMGRPDLPTPRQVVQLKAASQMQRRPLKWAHDGATPGTVTIEVPMPAQSLAAVTMEWLPVQGWKDPEP